MVPRGLTIIPALLLAAVVCLLPTGCGGGVGAQKDMLVVGAVKNLVAKPSDLTEGYGIDPEFSGPLEEDEVAEWHLGYEPLTSVPGFIEGYAVSLAGSAQSAARFHSEALVFRSVDAAEELFQTALRARDGGDYRERESPEADVGEESIGYDYRPTLWGDAMLPEGWTAYHVVWRYLNVHGTCTGMGKGEDVPGQTLRLARAQLKRMRDPANTTELESQALGPPADYELRDLGTLGGDVSWASGINDQGQVVGWSRIEPGEGPTPDSFIGPNGGMPALSEAVLAATGTAHAFLWKDDEMLDLGTLGGDSSYAKMVNDRGQVVGFSRTGAVEEHAFLWQDGEMVDLGTLGGKASTPRGLNNSGDVVGSSTTASGREHAFLWRNGKMTDLGTLGGDSSTAYGIDGTGQVIGASFTAKGKWHAFLWTEQGGMLDLGTLGGDSSTAYGINGTGQVVGASFTAKGKWHAFLWTEQGGMLDLGTLGGDSSYARAINESGQVVGASQRAGGPEWWQERSLHAFLWGNGKMTDLGTLGGDSSSAQAISDRGQIAGTSATPTGESHAALWTPKS